MHLYSVNGTNASYSPLQGWSNTKRYAFFAYYPLDKVSLVNLDGSKYNGGVPAIKYTMDATNANKLKESMVDVMIAKLKKAEASSSPEMPINLYWTSAIDNNIANGEVNLQFEHSLSCLSVNLNKTSSASIKVTDLKLTISNLNSSIVIPLDGEKPKPTGSIESMTFNIDLPEGGLALTTQTELADKLILIPQDEVVVTVSVEYERKYGDTDKSPSEPFTATLTTPLNAGTKHIIYLNFNDSNVYAMTKAGSWETGPNVDHEFN